MSDEPTTSDPAKTSRRLGEAFNRGDFAALEHMYAEDAVVVGDEIGRFDGAAAIRGLYEDMARPYDEVHAEIDEVIDLGNGVTLSVATVVGRPVGSSSEVRFRYAAAIVLADGVIARQTNFMDIDEGRAAAERLAGEPG